MTIREVFGGFQQATRGTAEERARFLFRLFDTDGSGELDQQEMYRMLLFAQSKQDVDRYEAVRVLDVLDKDKSGTVDEAEFVEGVCKDDEALAALSRVLGRTGIFGLAMQSKDARKTAAAERQRESRRAPPPSRSAASPANSGSDSQSRVAFVSPELGALAGSPAPASPGMPAGAMLTRPRGHSSATLDGKSSPTHRIGSPSARWNGMGNSSRSLSAVMQAVANSSSQGDEQGVHGGQVPASSSQNAAANAGMHAPSNPPGAASTLPSPPPRRGVASPPAAPASEIPLSPNLASFAGTKVPPAPPLQLSPPRSAEVSDPPDAGSSSSPLRAMASMFASKRSAAKQGSSRSLLSGVSAQKPSSVAGFSNGSKVPQFLGQIGRGKDSSRSLFGDEAGIVSKDSLFDGNTEHTLPSLRQLMKQNEDGDGFGAAVVTADTLGFGDDDSRSISRILKTPPSTNSGSLHGRQGKALAASKLGQTRNGLRRILVDVLPDVEEDLPVGLFESKVAEAKVVEENVIA